MAKTTNVSVRIPEDQKEQLMALAAQEGKACSDLLKEFIDLGLAGPTVVSDDTSEPVIETTVARSLSTRIDRSSLAIKTTISTLLDEAMKLQESSAKLRRLIEENGGNPGVFSKDAPEYLHEALRLCATRALQLSEKMKALSNEIAAENESLDYQQCPSCKRMVVAGNYCTAENYGAPPCKAKLPKTDQFWRKNGDWVEDFENDESSAADDC